MHSLYLTMSARYYPERRLVRCPPWKSLEMCWRVTNEGESGFGKANDRVEAKEHRLYGILGGSVVGCPLNRREKARPLFEGHYRVPSLYPKRSSQALRPGTLSPCRINAYGLLGRRRPKETWCCVRLPRCGVGFFPIDT